MVVAKSSKKPSTKKSTVSTSKISKASKPKTSVAGQNKTLTKSRQANSGKIKPRTSQRPDIELSLPNSASQLSPRYSWKIKLLIGLVIGLGLAIIGLIGYGALNLKQDLDDRSSAEQVSEIEDSGQVDASEIEQSVRALIDIPEDEQLINLAYINSQEALDTLNAGQAGLLSRAEIGDYYLVFDHRAILYRASSNKIIEYTPIIR
ncbi:hypothetical protein KC853_00865 [Candidatus Saccharibacteria bacterium]|nr:hypothetical protein [Candidatus Saccharibacteria bacterium]MCB9835077.1 hypothetical protein [Candidatus Nomurabacteria bacterium]